MAKIYNNEVGKRLAKNAGIQVSVDKVPIELAEKIVPTMETNIELLRKCTRREYGLANNSASATVYTTPTDRDFYLCGAQLSYIKDATATSAYSRLNVSVDGAILSIIHIPQFTLTAGNGSVAININPPLKVDRGTAISVVNSTNVANVQTAGNIWGYIDEQSNI